MTWPTRAALAVCLSIGVAAAAGASQWNERTTLKFSAPVMIPGKTLQPGTYTFRLADSQSSRQIVQIFEEDGSLVATTKAVPIKRSDPDGDTVLKFNPTDTSAAAAIKAWFYPGSIYGHEFVYPDDQARDIAMRTKTIVLSTDVPGSDMEKGTIYTYDAQGRRTGWHPDEQMTRDWDRWYQEQRAHARVAAPGTEETSEATAPMVQSSSSAMKVRLDEIESNPSRYMDKTVTVDGEVDEVFGPRLFKIDESDWADLDGEVLVTMPTRLAALVREDDHVTVTGRVQMPVVANIEREVGWLETNPDIEAEFDRHPIIVADRIVGGDSNVAMVIDVTEAQADPDTAVGTSGRSMSRSPITDLSMLANADEDFVGRRVTLTGVAVTRDGSHHGFWVKSGDTSVFVLPAAEKDAASAEGQSLSIQGVVLQMPDALRDRLDANRKANDDIYVYATSIDKR